jgi:hypothetical protein
VVVDVTVNDSTFEQNLRAAISAFGCKGSDPGHCVGESRIINNFAFPLAGEGFDVVNKVECDIGFDYIDLGGNVCTSNGQSIACQVSSVGLEAPEPQMAMP